MERLSSEKTSFDSINLLIELTPIYDLKMLMRLAIIKLCKHSKDGSISDRWATWISESR
uniref:Bm14332, isoform a n=1 Tax=Brugia malayi TaxID=6279 RepID=A0A1I9GC84_BRUMA|nr:Bm14332, isoform a [Brugia malayi]